MDLEDSVSWLCSNLFDIKKVKRENNGYEAQRFCHTFLTWCEDNGLINDYDEDKLFSFWEDE